MYNSKEELDEMMIACYDKCKDSNNNRSIGKYLWSYIQFCGNPIHYFDSLYQETIKQYLYSTQLNIPLYNSIQETPYSLLEDFLTIIAETDEISKEIAQTKSKGKK